MPCFTTLRFTTLYSALESRRKSRDSFDEGYVGDDEGYVGDDEDDVQHKKSYILDPFQQICCSGCTSPINVIGDTANVTDRRICKNPYGYLHEFFRLEGITPECRIQYDGEWHYEDSWYEDYAWMIIHCMDCESHWGWCYDTWTDSGKRFFGIRLKAICLRTY